MIKKRYAWIVLIGLSMLYYASNGYGYLSIPAFYPSLTSFFDSPKGVVPQSAFILSLTLALLSPITGYLLDKYNPKIILFLGVIGLIGMLFYFTKITTINELKLFNFGYAIMLSLGGFVTCMFILNQWFDRNKGMALGIFLNASSLGAAYFSPMIGNSLKNGLSWQEIATKMCGITSIFLIIPLFFIKTVSKNKAASPKNTAQEIDKKESFHSNILQKSIKTSNFWLLLFVTGFLWFIINAVLFHKDSFLADINLDAAERGKFSQTFFLCGILGKLLFGFLSDQFNTKLIMQFSIINIILACLLLIFSLGNLHLIFLVAVVFGLGYSGAFTMIQLMIAELYSGNSYGKILGIFIMADTLFGSLGVYLLGSFRGVSGSYALPFYVLIFIASLALILSFFIKKNQTNEITTR